MTQDVMSEDDLKATFGRLHDAYAKASELADADPSMSMSLNVVDFIVMYEHADMWAKRLEEEDALIETFHSNLAIHYNNVDTILAGRKEVRLSNK